jgi:hypothetical protein
MRQFIAAFGRGYFDRLGCLQTLRAPWEKVCSKGVLSGVLEGVVDGMESIFEHL